jgi:DNA-binding XRE family transcriptional regulator
MKLKAAVMSLREARNAAEFTQVQLADASGVPQSVISAIETAQELGQDRDVTLATARALVRALRAKKPTRTVTLDDLFPEAR